MCGYCTVPLRPKLSSIPESVPTAGQLKSPTQTCTEPCWAWSHRRFFTSKARRSFVRSDLGSVCPGPSTVCTCHAELWEYSFLPQCWDEGNEIEFFSYLGLRIGTLVELLTQAYNSFNVGTWNSPYQYCQMIDGCYGRILNQSHPWDFNFWCT